MGKEILADEKTVSALAPARRRDLAGILVACDMVKFACALPGASERERLLSTATTVVTETKGDGA